MQALRSLAIFLVVMRHVQVYMARAMNGTPRLGSFRAGDMGVDLFFVISGCILVVNHRETFTRGRDAARFLYRRAARIYPLYWLYSLPVLAIYHWRPGWLHRLEYGMAVDPVRSFLLWPQEGWPLLGQAWSLVYDVYFYLAFAGWLFLPGKFFRRGLLAWAAVVTAGSFLLSAHPALARPEPQVVFSELTLEFIAGALVGLSLRPMPVREAALKGALALGLGGVLTARAFVSAEPPFSGLERVIDYGLPCAALVYGAVRLETAGWRAARGLEMIGDWSYSIYLSHIFVIAALVHWLPYPRLGEAGLELALVAAVILVGAGSYHGLEAPLGRLVRRGWPRVWTNGRRWLPAPGPMAAAPKWVRPGCEASGE